MFKKALDLDNYHNVDDVHCTSHLISEKAQLAFRALALGYCLSTLFSNFVYTASLTFFTFFTNLSYILLTCYFATIVFLSVTHTSPIGFQSVKRINSVNVLLEVVATNALFLDIVYWGLLYRYSTGMTTMHMFFCVNVHLFNLLLILTEVITNKFKFSPRHIVFTMAFLAAYTTFAFLYYVFDNTWVYPILDWHRPQAPLVYGGVIVLNITCFFAMLAISKARDAFVTRRARKNNGFTALEEGTGATTLYTSESVTSALAAALSPSPPSSKSSSPSSTSSFSSGVSSASSSRSDYGSMSEYGHVWMPAVKTMMPPAISVGSGAM